MRRTLTAFLLIGPLVALLSACADGSGNSTRDPDYSGAAPRLAAGDLVVRVVDTAGIPVAGAWATISDPAGNAGGATTGADGSVAFGSVRAGPVDVRAFAWGYHDSASVRVQVAESRTTQGQVTLVPRNASTAAVLGTRAVSQSADGRTLVFETDIAVLDESGQPLLGLTDAMFELPAIECGWGLCVNDRTGQEIASWSPVDGFARDLRARTCGAPTTICGGPAGRPGEHRHERARRPTPSRRDHRLPGALHRDQQRRAGRIQGANFRIGTADPW